MSAPRRATAAVGELAAKLIYFGESRDECDATRHDSAHERARSRRKGGPFHVHRLARHILTGIVELAGRDDDDSKTTTTTTTLV